MAAHHRIKANRLLARHAKAHGDKGRVRLSFGKVAEYQRRGVVHFHALIRLDGIDPDHPEQVVAPPAWATVFVLDPHASATPSSTTAFRTEPHPANPDGWPIALGRHSSTSARCGCRGDEAITDTAVAGYLAKYATKGTDATGHSPSGSPATPSTSTPTTAPPRPDHPRRVAARRHRRLRRAAPMGAHARLRRALLLQDPSATRRRSARCVTRAPSSGAARSRRTVDVQLAADHDEEPALVINTLAYVGIGWHTTGDALLANTSAAMARERRRARVRQSRNSKRSGLRERRPMGSGS